MLVGHYWTPPLNRVMPGAKMAEKPVGAVLIENVLQGDYTSKSQDAQG